MTEHRSVPDWLLERLAAGELPAGQARELEARLDSAGERWRLDALARSNAEISSAYPAQAVAAEVSRRAGAIAEPGDAFAGRGGAAARHARDAGSAGDAEAARETRSTLGAWPMLALGGAAALALALVISSGGLSGAERQRSLERSPEVPGEAGGARPEEQRSAEPEHLIDKGLEPHLSIYRRTSHSPERLPPKARVRAGDTLQLAYVAAGRRFGVVASVDGRGVVSLHLPEAAGPAVALDHRGETALPHAFELDDTPGVERFVFVTSESPFDTATVVAHLEGRAPHLPAALSLRSIELEKSTP